VALNNLAWIYQLRNDPQARIAAQKAYTLGPTPQAADTLGWVLATQGQATTGVMLLRQAASQLPDDPTIQYHYAAALNATGQHDEAERTLRGLLAKQVSFDERADAEKLLQALNGPAAPAGAPAVR
jgi:Flp pilus assembly protein TadD